jgi:raffinose/stachyose/melibiose transport system substrate-binding protein
VGSTRSRAAFLAAAVVAAASLAGDARPADATTTINVLGVTSQKPGLDVLVANFERVYPNITVDLTYAPTTAVRDQLELTQLGAGTGPDVLSVSPGCFKPAAVCTFAKAGSLAAMVDKPWVRWSLPFVTSLDKYGRGLYAFTPQLGLFGIFTNDDLFRKLGLQVPQTFQQLLALCPKAKAGGTVALISSSDVQEVSNFLVDLAVTTVYARDPHWSAKLRAGKVTFDGTPGWHQALQEYIDLYSAGCFEPGLTGTSAVVAHSLFGQGQGLIEVTLSYNKGAIDASDPQFHFTHHPFPGGTGPDQPTTLINLQAGFGVNAHSSPQNQAAAQTFIDFIARPKQTALFAQINGGLTQYEFLHQQLPAFMGPDAQMLAKHEYVINPLQAWWNPGVLTALQANQIGLLTGQRSIDDVLNAMDAAWKQGPA